MSYLVMEVHPGYAVLLDPQGRFIKAANMGYEVGQTVTNIVPMKMQPRQNRSAKKQILSFVLAAACLCLIFFGAYRGIYLPNYTAYGTLEMQINPKVQLTLSQTENVLDLKGTNQDGERLVEGYDPEGKNRETVVEELTDKALEMGFLTDGDQIAISVDSSDRDWREHLEQQAIDSLQEHVDALSITVIVSTSIQEDQDPQPSSVVIPIEEPIPSPSQTTPQPSATNTTPNDDDGGDDDDDDRVDSQSNTNANTQTNDKPAISQESPSHQGDDDDDRDDDSGDDNDDNDDGSDDDDDGDDNNDSEDDDNDDDGSGDDNDDNDDGDD